VSKNGRQNRSPLGWTKANSPKINPSDKAEFMLDATVFKSSALDIVYTVKDRRKKSKVSYIAIEVAVIQAGWKLTKTTKSNELDRKCILTNDFAKKSVPIPKIRIWIN
jgi:hypothetical protein